MEQHSHNSWSYGTRQGLRVYFKRRYHFELECGPMPKVMAALPNIGGAPCSTPQSLPDAHYYSAVQ